VWSKPLRRALYPVDLAIFLAIRFYVATVRRRVLVTDRYFYDTLVDVADDGRWFWVRLLERLTPEPDVPVFLDVSPEESYARKGEYSAGPIWRAAARLPGDRAPGAVRRRPAQHGPRCTRRPLQRAVEERPLLMSSCPFGCIIGCRHGARAGRHAARVYLRWSRYGRETPVSLRRPGA